MLLVISKHPQFTESGEVVLGQCAPYTTGWRLRIVDHGREEVLLTGTYYDLRRAQETMAGKEAEEMRRIATEMGREFETAAKAEDAFRQLPRRRPMDADETTAVMSSVEVTAALKDEHERAQTVAQLEGVFGQNGSFTRLVHKEGVLILTVAGSKFLNKPETVGGDLERVLALRPRGLVFDFGDVQVISTGGIRELVRATDLCGSQGVPMAVAQLVPGIRKVLEMASLDSIIPIHESVEAAWESLHEIARRPAPESPGAESDE
jgi:anti-anti-sigma factor